MHILPRDASRHHRISCHLPVQQTRALSALVHLGYGLGVILAFIGVKRVLHWAHGVWPAVPEIPTVLSLVVVVLILM